MEARRPDPCILVIFGGSGDLTKRLIVPSLYNLTVGGLIPERFAVIGVGRAALTTGTWRQELEGMAKQFVRTGGCALGEEFDAAAWGWLAERLIYFQADLADPAGYQRLDRLIAERAEADGIGRNVIFYLAIGDRLFGPVVDALGRAGLLRQSAGAWRRVVIEKPFGHDLASARALDRQILSVLEEDQIYRIDHYLGKETVQNIMVLRFANGFFEPLWNRDHIDHVQITAAETLGVEKRGKFYDQTGALRDMVPNHMFQLLSMVAMEPPTSFAANAVRNEKAKVLEAVRLCSAEEALHCSVRGQYGPGIVQGEPVVGYRQGPDVAPDSRTETYAACKFLIENWRWAGVPFYLRTGKRLARRSTQIVIEFRQAPFTLFRDTPTDQLAANRLVLQIQPDEGATLEFDAKVPGPTVRIAGVRMDFKYKDYFSVKPNTGYETLLYDCMIGDQTLFQRADFVEAGWSVVQPILDSWAQHPPPDFPNYAAGSAGPAEADELLARDGRAWLPLS